MAAANILRSATQVLELVAVLQAMVAVMAAVGAVEATQFPAVALVGILAMAAGLQVITTPLMTGMQTRLALVLMALEAVAARAVPVSSSETAAAPAAVVLASTVRGQMGLAVVLHHLKLLVALDLVVLAGQVEVHILAGHMAVGLPVNAAADIPAPAVV